LERGVSGACKKIGSADPAAPRLLVTLAVRRASKNEGFKAGDFHRRFADLRLFANASRKETGEQQTTQLPTASVLEVCC
jgi:hypothetical protein